MFNLKKRELYTYWAFVYWDKNIDNSEAACITVFRDKLPIPEMVEFYLPDESVYHTKIVKITTTKPLINPDGINNTVGIGYIYEEFNGNCDIIMDEGDCPVPVVGLKII